jgi:hypothetical protein
MLEFSFKNFYIAGYEGSIDTIYYEGTDPTIVIMHTFYNEDGDKIKLYYYVSNKTGELTLRNIYEALDAQTDACLKIYITTNTRKLYIEDLKRINPISFELITYGYCTDDETSE